uniref:BZIP domain-containing protein n=1 Tax=Panagrolaimus sp. ES5 TaxID=591445 RepID=A0AC34FAV6_9BILA
MAAVAVSVNSRENLPKDKIELWERPGDLGLNEEENERLCDELNGLAFKLRPTNLDSEEAPSEESPSTNNNNSLFIDEGDEDEESDDAEILPRSAALRNLSTTSSSEKRVVPNFRNPPLSISDLSFMDTSAGVEFLHEQLISSRKRLEDVPEFLSEPPPSKRSKHSERRRGRPRKEEISENEDLKTVAKRMYARAYRENMKSKFVEVEIQLNDLRKEHALLKASHKKLESLVEQCNFCSSSWALVKNMNIDPVVLRMAYDTLTNIKSPSGSPSSKSDEDDRSASASIEC